MQQDILGLLMKTPEPELARALSDHEGGIEDSIEALKSRRQACSADNALCLRVWRLPGSGAESVMHVMLWRYPRTKREEEAAIW